MQSAQGTVSRNLSSQTKRRASGDFLPEHDRSGSMGGIGTLQTILTRIIRTSRNLHFERMGTRGSNVPMIQFKTEANFGGAMSWEAKKYFAYARECARLAEQASSVEKRNKLFELAHVWMDAALTEEQAAVETRIFLRLVGALLDEPGLIANECPKCRYVESKLQQPTRRVASGKAEGAPLSEGSARGRKTSRRADGGFIGTQGFSRSARG